MRSWSQCSFRFCNEKNLGLEMAIILTSWKKINAGEIQSFDYRGQLETPWSDVCCKHVITACTRRIVDRKYCCYVTFFPTSLSIPMGSRNALLLDHIVIERLRNCLTCNQNTTDSNSGSLMFFFKSLARTARFDSTTIQGVCLNDIPTAEETLGIKIFLYDVDIVDRSFVSGLARWSREKHPYSVRLLCYNSHIHYVTSVPALFNAFRWWTCECYFCLSILNFIQQLVLGQRRKFFPTVRKGWMKHLDDRLDFFDIPYPNTQKLSAKAVTFQFKACTGRTRNRRHKDDKINWKTHSNGSINPKQHKSMSGCA